MYYIGFFFDGFVLSQFGPLWPLAPAATRALHRLTQLTPILQPGSRFR